MESAYSAPNQNKRPKQLQIPETNPSRVWVTIIHGNSKSGGQVSLNSDIPTPMPRDTKSGKYFFSDLIYSPYIKLASSNLINEF